MERKRLKSGFHRRKHAAVKQGRRPLKDHRKTAYGMRNRRMPLEAEHRAQVSAEALSGAFSTVKPRLNEPRLYCYFLSSEQAFSGGRRSPERFAREGAPRMQTIRGAPCCFERSMIADNSFRKRRTRGYELRVMNLASPNDISLTWPSVMI
jgi:hypothetical protein